MSQLSVEMLVSRTKTCLINIITILTKIFRSIQTPVLACMTKEPSVFSSPLKMAYIPNPETQSCGTVRKIGETSLPNTPIEKTLPKQPRREVAGNSNPETAIDENDETALPETHDDASLQIDNLTSIANALSLSSGKKQFAANHRQFDEILTRHMKESNGCYFCSYRTKEYKPSIIFRHMQTSCQKMKQLSHSSGTVMATDFAYKSNLAVRRLNAVRARRKG